MKNFLTLLLPLLFAFTCRAQNANNKDVQAKMDSIHDLLPGTWMHRDTNDVIYISHDSIKHKHLRDGNTVVDKFAYFLILCPQFKGSTLAYNISLCDLKQNCCGDKNFPYMLIYSVNPNSLKLGKKGRLIYKKVKQYECHCWG